MKKLLFITDLYYEAKGRAYYEEDLYLTSELRKDFQLVICHPKDTEPFEQIVDGIVFRNAGPVVEFKEEYAALRQRMDKFQLKTYNSLNGKADMNGKQYLIECTNEKFPVIPTVDTLKELNRLPEVDTYIVKPKDGADSIGMTIVSKDDLPKVVDNHTKDTLIQPCVNFQYEVSFYFIDREFQYALYALNKSKRWQLKYYNATKEDLVFAQKFIDWNNLNWGIQRVDACRTTDGQLLLVELEDLNPYLSLLELTPEFRHRFVVGMKKSIQNMLQS
ncbi:hypothetical protein ABEW32_15830 [Paenibacillus jamilae]|uniref:hypothetical protein n=1 Tax=Paenibacillus jamilae TaxID=114136 RepID=UPI003D2B832D